MSQRREIRRRLILERKARLADVLPEAARPGSVRPLQEVLPTGAWRGRRCLVLAGGESAGWWLEHPTSADLLRTELVIAVNPPPLDRVPAQRTDAARALLSHANVAISADRAFWTRGLSYVPATTLRVQAAHHEGDVVAGVDAWARLGEIDGWAETLVEPLGHGGNSGHVALQVAWCLGADPIYVLGLDAAPFAGRSHWHDAYQRGPDERRAWYEIARSSLDAISPRLRGRVFRVSQPSDRSSTLETVFSLAEDGITVTKLAAPRHPVSIVMATLEVRAPFRDAFVLPAARASGAAELVLVRGDGMRPGEALNIGFARASQPFVLWLDDDCVLAHDALDRLVAALSADRWAAVAYGDYLGIVHPGATPHPCGPVWRQETGPWDLEALRRRNLVPSIALWNRTLLPRDPPWAPDVPLLYDWDLALALAEIGGHGVHVGGAPLFHAHWLPGPTETNTANHDARERAKVEIRDRHERLVVGGRTRPRLLLLPDVRGWAFDVNLRDMAEYLADDFEFVFHYMLDGDPPRDLMAFCPGGTYLPYHHALDHRPQDLGHVFSSLRSASLRPADKLLVDEHDAAYVNRFRGFHVTTLQAFDALAPHCPRLAYLTNPVNTRRFSLTPVRAELVLSWSGNGRHRTTVETDVKGYGIAEAAMRESGLRYQVAEYHTSRRLPSDMPAFYAAANVTLAAGLYEGASNSVMEAMASGHAIISTPVGNATEIAESQRRAFGESGIAFVRERSVSGFAEAIETLRRDPARVRAMGDINRAEIIARWSWDVWASRYAAFLRGEKFDATA